MPLWQHWTGGWRNLGLWLCMWWGRASRRRLAGSRSVFGVMVESHLQAGAQKFTPGKDRIDALTYGQSITDACLGWDDSVGLLETLSQAIKQRRG